MAALNRGRCVAQLVNPQVLPIILTIEVDSQLPEYAFDKETCFQALQEHKCLWDTSDQDTEYETECMADIVNLIQSRRYITC